jgi:IS4 transposase
VAAENAAATIPGQRKALMLDELERALSLKDDFWEQALRSLGVTFVVLLHRRRSHQAPGQQLRMHCRSPR